MHGKLSSDPPILLIECVNESPTQQVSDILSRLNYRFYRINDKTNKLIRASSLTIIKKNNGAGHSILDRDNLNALCIPSFITEAQLANLIN